MGCAARWLHESNAKAIQHPIAQPCWFNWSNFSADPAPHDEPMCEKRSHTNMSVLRLIYLFALSALLGAYPCIAYRIQRSMAPHLFLPSSPCTYYSLSVSFVNFRQECRRFVVWIDYHYLYYVVNGRQRVFASAKLRRVFFFRWGKMMCYFCADSALIWIVSSTHCVFNSIHLHFHGRCSQNEFRMRTIEMHECSNNKLNKFRLIAYLFILCPFTSTVCCDTLK